MTRKVIAHSDGRRYSVLHADFLAIYEALGFTEVADEPDPPVYPVPVTYPAVDDAGAWDDGPCYYISHADGRHLATTYLNFVNRYAALGFTIGLGEHGESLPYLGGPFFRAGVTPDRAAPLPSPYTELGAVGSLTAVDTGSKLAVVGGLLHASGGSSTTDPQVYGTALTRVCGRAVLGQVTLTNQQYQTLGWRSNIATPVTEGAIEFYSTGPLFVYQGADIGPFATLSTGVAYQVAVVLRDTGLWYLIKGGAFANWTLFWVDSAKNAATLRPYFNNYIAGVSDLGNLRYIDLGGLWSTDTGIATTYKAATVNGDTATQTPDANIYHTITAQTGVTQELKFRITDALNYWLLRMAAPGTNTIKIIEVIAGVEQADRASTAQTFVNAAQYRIGVTMEGASLRAFVDNAAKGVYASAATGLSATGVSVSHAGTKLEVWPRNPVMPGGVL